MIPIPDNISATEARRFRSHVGQPTHGGCMEWTGSLTAGRYGRVRLRKHVLMAHRVSWAIAHGPVPVGLCVCHHCDNTTCVNPEHLFAGTHTDNMRDCSAKRRFTAGRLSYARAHPELMARGERSAMARVTTAMVLEIRSLYAGGGLLQREIADRFGVSKQHISRLVLGQRWRHVTQAGEQT